MRIFLASILSIAALACSSSKKGDESNEKTVTGVDAAVEPEPVEIDPSPDLSTPYKAVYQALLAAQIEDDQEAFEAYLELVDPDQVNSAEAKEAVRTVQWLRFRTQHDWYVRSGSKADYIMTRMIPAEVTEETTEVRIFVRDLLHKNNAPVEIVLKRHGNEWRIVSNSM